MKELTAHDRYQERQRIAEEQHNMNKHNAFTMPPDPTFSRALKKSQWGKAGGEAAYKTAGGKAIAYGMRTPANKSTKPKENT